MLSLVQSLARLLDLLFPRHAGLAAMSSLSPPQTLDQGSVQQHSSTRAIPAPAGLATELQQVGAPAVTALAAGEGSLSGRAPGEATGAAFGSPFEAPSLGPALSIGPPPPFGVALPTAPSGREQLAGEQPRLPRVLSIRASRRGSLNCSGDASSSPALQAAAAQQQQQQQAAARRPAPDVWGWLQPGRPSLPYVLLQGQGVVLGRGHDAIKERLLPPLMQSPSAPAADGGAGPAPRTPSGSFGRLPDSTSPLAAALAGGASAGAGTGPTSSSASISSGSPRRSGREAAPSPNATGRDGREAAFVEIADGRISRLHCWISRDASGHPYLEVRSAGMAARVACAVLALWLPPAAAAAAAAAAVTPASLLLEFGGCLPLLWLVFFGTPPLCSTIPMDP